MQRFISLKHQTINLFITKFFGSFDILNKALNNSGQFRGSIRDDAVVDVFWTSQDKQIIFSNLQEKQTKDHTLYNMNKKRRGGTKAHKHWRQRARN